MRIGGEKNSSTQQRPPPRRLFLPIRLRKDLLFSPRARALVLLLALVPREHLQDPLQHGQARQSPVRRVRRGGDPGVPLEQRAGVVARLGDGRGRRCRRRGDDGVEEPARSLVLGRSEPEQEEKPGVGVAREGGGGGAGRGAPRGRRRRRRRRGRNLGGPAKDDAFGERCHAEDAPVPQPAPAAGSGDLGASGAAGPGGVRRGRGGVVDGQGDAGDGAGVRC